MKELIGIALFIFSLYMLWKAVAENDDWDFIVDISLDENGDIKNDSKRMD